MALFFTGFKIYSRLLNCIWKIISMICTAGFVSLRNENGNSCNQNICLASRRENKSSWGISILYVCRRAWRCMAWWASAREVRVASSWRWGKFLHVEDAYSWRGIWLKSCNFVLFIGRNSGALIISTHFDDSAIINSNQHSVVPNLLFPSQSLLRVSPQDYISDLGDYLLN